MKNLCRGIGVTDIMYDKIMGAIPMEISEVIDYFSLDHHTKSAKNFAMIFLDKDGGEWGAIFMDGDVEYGSCGSVSADELVRSKLKEEW